MFTKCFRQWQPALLALIVVVIAKPSFASERAFLITQRLNLDTSISGYEDQRMDKDQPECLVVIDMQSGFKANLFQGPIVDHIQDEIQTAMRHGMAIIFVEYVDNSDYGATIPVLLNLTRRYKNAFRITKSQDSGASVVLKLLEKLGYHFIHKIRVVGILTADCIQKTALGLCQSERVGSVVVVEKACDQTASYHPQFSRKCLEAMQKIGVSKLKIEFVEDESEEDLEVSW